MALTMDEKKDLKDFVLERTCSEYRRDQPCVQRSKSPMVGPMHAGCLKAEAMLVLVDKA